MIEDLDTRARNIYYKWSGLCFDSVFKSERKGRELVIEYENKLQETYGIDCAKWSSIEPLTDDYENLIKEIGTALENV
jgi:hypothetical protein|tara:strand:- start:304 stop:537 length:234 start_codon:yes stop_codon:yes gene_type:complete